MVRSLEIFENGWYRFRRNGSNPPTVPFYQFENEFDSIIPPRPAGFGLVD